MVDGSPQVSRLDASGNVFVTRPDQTARSQYAIYDLNARTILMMGDVTLTQGGNVTHSQRLTLNLAEAQPHATLGGGGRVTGTFSVPKRN